MSSSRVVLMVEDDALVSVPLREALADVGLGVLEATNAAEALATLDERPDVSAVVTDVDMPGPMNGPSLAWEVRARRPGLPVVLISGKLPPTARMIPEGVAFLQKPFALDALVERLDEMVRAADRVRYAVEVTVTRSGAKRGTLRRARSREQASTLAERSTASCAAPV